jgi:hypothetical protein
MSESGCMLPCSAVQCKTFTYKGTIYNFETRVQDMTALPEA